MYVYADEYKNVAFLRAETCELENVYKKKKILKETNPFTYKIVYTFSRRAIKHVVSPANRTRSDCRRITNIEQSTYGNDGFCTPLYTDNRAVPV